MATPGGVALAAIIVSHNSSGWLERCLSSVYARSGDMELDVVVVDSGSTDDTIDLVRRNFPDVRVLATENHGFAIGEQPWTRDCRCGVGAVPQPGHSDPVGDARRLWYPPFDGDQPSASWG